MHKQKGPLGQVLLEFRDLKKESPRGPTHLRPKSLNSPRGTLIRRLNQMHKQKGPLGQVLLEFWDLKKESPRGPTNLKPKSLNSPKFQKTDHHNGGEGGHPNGRSQGGCCFRGRCTGVCRAKCQQPKANTHLWAGAACMRQGKCGL